MTPGDGAVPAPASAQERAESAVQSKGHRRCAGRVGRRTLGLRRLRQTPSLLPNHPRRTPGEANSVPVSP